MAKKIIRIVLIVIGVFTAFTPKKAVITPKIINTIPIIFFDIFIILSELLNGVH